MLEAKFCIPRGYPNIFEGIVETDKVGGKKYSASQNGVIRHHSNSNDIENRGRYFSKQLQFPEELKIPRPTTTSSGGSRSTTTNNSEHNTSSGPILVPNLQNSNGNVVKGNAPNGGLTNINHRHRHKSSSHNMNGDISHCYNSQNQEEAFNPSNIECNNSRGSRSQSSHTEESSGGGSPASAGSSGSDGMIRGRGEHAKSVNNHHHQSDNVRVINDRNYRRSSSVVNSEESDLQRKKSSSAVSSYKVCQQLAMYFTYLHLSQT